MNGFIKRLAAVLVATLCQSAAAATVQQGSDTLSFFDGAKLRGKLLSIDPGAGVTWSHPEAKRPIKFRPRNLHEIRFSPLRGQAADAQATCLARFTNGDQMRGQLLSLDDKTAELDTWFAGRVKSDRKALRSLTFSRAGLSTVFRGPTGPEGWHSGHGVANKWRYDDGAFTTTNVSFLGRKIELPPSMRLAFDAEWDGPLSLLLTVQSDLVTQFSYGAGGYMFSIGEGFVSLQRSGRIQAAGPGNPALPARMNRSFLGQAKVPELLYRKRAQMEIRTSADSSNLFFLVNGKLAQQWHDASGMLPTGDGVTFYSQRNGSRLRISNISITEWGGDIDSETPTDDETDRPLIRLANKDHFSGDVHSIREGKLNVSTGKIQLNVPMERVRQVVLESPPMDPSEHSPADVRAFFTDQSQVTIKLKSWTPSGIAGTHAHVGDVTLQPNWVQKLGFNLHRGKPPADADAAATMEVDPHWPKRETKAEAK